MARVGKDVWKEFQEVNTLFEKGGLKGQKANSVDVLRGSINLKQWHMKPLSNLSDGQKLTLLRKVKEKKLSLKELKEEAQNVKTLSQAQGAILRFFHLEHWQDAVERFGGSVSLERLSRFKGDFEKLHEFKMFLRHLEKRGVATYEEHGEMIIGIANGEIQGHLVFSKFDKVDLSASYFENGAFLSIGHVGCHSEDIDEEVSTVVDMTMQINFKRLMTMFNIIIVCSAAALHHVQMKMASAGAGQIQTGFIAKRKHVPNSKELLMTKTVDCFVVGHWALSHNKLTERHVSRHMTNLIDVKMEEDGYPQDMYECFIQTFSKEGDLVLDIGSENGNGMLTSLKLKRPSIFISESLREGKGKAEFAEQLKERAALFGGTQ